MINHDRSHIAWLNSQLTFWQEKGWITPDAAKAMSGHYGTAPEYDARRVASILLAVLAALLIGGGVILIFAYNWENIARPLRALISITPLLFTYAFGYRVLKRETDSAAIREGAAVGNMCALAAAIGLVGQTYNIPGDLTSFLTTVCVLSLPAVYLFRSNAAATLYLAGIVTCRWASMDIYSGSSTSHPYPVFWVMLALIVPFILVQARDGRSASVRWLVFAALAATAIALPPNACDTWGVISAYALLASSVIGFCEWDEENRFLASGVARISFFGLFVILIVTSFGDVWRQSDFYDPAGKVSTIALLSVLGLANVAALTLAIGKRDLLGILWTALAPLIVLIRLLSLGNPDADNVALLVNAIGFAAGFATMSLGYKGGRMGLVNFGLAVMSGIFLMRFFDSDMSMLARGCSFIVIGIVFVVVNVKMSRDFKKEKVS